jgi:hypothetical protein
MAAKSTRRPRRDWHGLEVRAPAGNIGPGRNGGCVTTEVRLLTDAEIERRLLDRRADAELDVLFGAMQHAELRDLARRARDQRGGARVLILPGIMGSTLGIRRPGRSDDIKWFDPVEIALGGLTKLALPSSRRIVPLGVLLFVYLRLKLSLSAAGFDADFHPYDWRMSVRDAGRALAERLEHESRRKVSLVAHSLGGLVARAALAHRGARRIERVIQLGTPNRGAFATIQALRGTYALVRRLALLDLAHGPRTLARDVFCTLPGLVELLPDPAACDGMDPFKAGDWPSGPRPKAALLAAARKLRKDLPDPDERFALIAGSGHDTPTGARIRGDKMWFRYSDEGDGTVPLALARLDGLASWIAPCEHGALPGDDTVTQAVAELLEQGDTSLLPREPAPVARRGRWLGEKEPEAAGEKLFWDDLAPLERQQFLREFVAPPDGGRRGGAGTRDVQPVEVAFEVGSITDAGAVAIVLGLFSNVEPAGAAIAVDALLGGAIGDLSRRRAIAAAAGEVFILPAASPGLRANYVVFAGLGHFSRYGAEVQRLAAANVTRTLSLAGVRDFALVLWGTASGIPPAHAAQSQLAGMLEALAELPPGQRPRRVTLVSRSPRRLATARAAMRMQLGDSDRAGLLRLGALPPATSRRAKVAASATTPTSYLFVQESGQELRAALLGVTPKATALAGARKLESRELDLHLDSLGTGLDASGLREFGQRLGELLLPDATREALSAAREVPLVVVHDRAASRWPWEALSIDGWEPAATAGLCRRYVADGMSVAKWREERRLSPDLRVLLVVNPTEDLPGAQDEGRRVARVLARTDARVTELHGSEATRARLLEEFRSGRYDAIHYAGHAFFDATSPSSGGILCAGGRVLSGADLAALEALPALVCFNACESGRVRQASGVQRALGRSTGFAEAFLRGGVANFIGTWWPVSDAAAAVCAGTLYERLMRGETIGAALKAARSEVLKLGSANYLHYGGFDFVLKR